MAFGKGPGLEERCEFTYRLLPTGSPAPNIEDRFVSAMFELGFRRLGQVGSHLKVCKSDCAPMVTEVFVVPTEATYGAMFHDTTVGADTFCFTTVLEDGLAIATASDLPDWWWKRYGTGARLGRDEQYDEVFFASDSLTTLRAGHAERVATACAARKTRPRASGTMALYLALRTARSRARAAWYAGQLRTGVVTAAAVMGAAASSLMVPGILALKRAGVAEGVSLAVGMALAMLAYVVLLRSPVLRYLLLSVGPRVHSWLRRGRQVRHTDLAAAEFEQSVQASGVRA